MENGFNFKKNLVTYGIRTRTSELQVQIFHQSWIESKNTLVNIDQWPKVHLNLTKSSHPSQEKVTNAWMGWEVPYFLSSNVTSAENGFSFTSMTKGESLEKRGKKCFLFLTEMVANFLKYEEIDTKKSDIQSQQLFSCQTFPIKVKFKRLGY